MRRWVQRKLDVDRSSCIAHARAALATLLLLVGLSGCVGPGLDPPGARNSRLPPSATKAGTGGSGSTPNGPVVGTSGTTGSAIDSGRGGSSAMQIPGSGMQGGVAGAGGRFSVDAGAEEDAGALGR